MKYLFAALLFLALALPAFAQEGGRIGLPPQPVLDPHEFLNNPGFETGTFSGWASNGSCWGSGPVTTPAPHSGTYSIYSTTGVCGLDTAFSTLNLAPLQPINGSNQVEIAWTAWVQTTGTNGIVGLAGKDGDTYSATYLLGSWVGGGTNGWTQIGGTTTLIAGGESNWILGVYTGTYKTPAQAIGSGGGSTVTSFSYATPAPYLPITASGVSISYTIGGTVYTATDNGSGAITGTDLSGTVNYTTGAISLTYTTGPDSGTAITLAAYTIPSATSGDVQMDDFSFKAIHQPLVTDMAGNYRGMVFSDYSQTIPETVWITPDIGATDLPTTLKVTVTNASGGATLATDSYAISSNPMTVTIPWPSGGATAINTVTAAYDASGTDLGDDQTQPASAASVAVGPAWEFVTRNAFPDGLLGAYDNHRRWWHQDTTLAASVAAAATSFTATADNTMNVGELVIVPGAWTYEDGAYITAISGTTVTVSKGADGAVSSGVGVWVQHAIFGFYGTYSASYSNITAASGWPSAWGWRGEPNYAASIASTCHGCIGLDFINENATNAIGTSGRAGYANANLTNADAFLSPMLWDGIYSAPGGNYAGPFTSTTCTTVAGSTTVDVASTTPFGASLTNNLIEIANAGTDGMPYYGQVTAVGTGTVTVATAPALSAQNVNCLGLDSNTAAITSNMLPVFESGGTAVAATGPYYVCDECDSSANKGPWSEQREGYAYNWIRSNAPNSPAWGVLIGEEASPYASGAILDPWRWTMDAMAFDEYPVAFSDAKPPFYLFQTGRDMQTLTRDTGGLRPLYGVQQAFDWTGGGRYGRNFPIAKEMAVQALSSFVNGARGFWLWELGDYTAGYGHAPNGSNWGEAASAALAFSTAGTMASGSDVVTVTNAGGLAVDDTIGFSSAPTGCFLGAQVTAISGTAITTSCTPTAAWSGTVYSNGGKWQQIQPFLQMMTAMRGAWDGTSAPGLIAGPIPANIWVKSVLSPDGHHWVALVNFGWQWEPTTYSYADSYQWLGTTVGTAGNTCFNLNVAAAAMPTSVTEVELGGTTQNVNVANGQVCLPMPGDGYAVFYW